MRVFVAGGEWGRECQWFADYFRGIFKTLCLAWGCFWSERHPVAICFRVSICCTPCNTEFAAQCLSPEYYLAFGFCLFSFHPSAVLVL